MLPRLLRRFSKVRYGNGVFCVEISAATQDSAFVVQTVATMVDGCRICRSHIDIVPRISTDIKRIIRCSFRVQYPANLLTCPRTPFAFVGSVTIYFSTGRMFIAYSNIHKLSLYALFLLCCICTCYYCVTLRNYYCNLLALVLAVLLS